MFKKVTAFSFILIANIIMLTHDVIPHHHHQKKVCLESEHCVNDAAPHNHEQAEHDHQNDSNNNPNACFLSEFVFVPSNNTYRLSNYQHYGDNHFKDFHFIHISEDTRISILVTKVNIFLPDLIPIYLSTVNASIGLRAPPVV